MVSELVEPLPLAIANVPVASVPMSLNCTKLPVEPEPVMSMPYWLLPEITLPLFDRLSAGLMPGPREPNRARELIELLAAPMLLLLELLMVTPMRLPAAT